MAVLTSERAIRLPVELLLLGTVGFLWGAQFGFTKIQLETMPPVTAVAIRLAIAAAFMWALVIAQGASVPTGLRNWRDFTIQGVLTSAGPGMLIAWGQQYVDSALAAILNSTSPILVSVITLLYTRQESIGPKRVLGLAIGLAGVITVIGFGALDGLGRGFVSQLVIMSATFGYATATLFGRRFTGFSPVAAAAATITCSTILMAILAFAVEQPFAIDPSMRSMAATAASGMLCNGLGVTIYFRLIRTLGSVGTSTVSFLKAAFGVVIGCFLLGEPFTASIAIGLTAVLIGVAAVNEPGASKGTVRG
jgi:drug/metabolite transporter (DMT)-like permease